MKFKYLIVATGFLLMVSLCGAAEISKQKKKAGKAGSAKRVQISEACRQDPRFICRDMQNREDRQECRQKHMEKCFPDRAAANKKKEHLVQACGNEIETYCKDKAGRTLRMCLKQLGPKEMSKSCRVQFFRTLDNWGN